MVFIFPGVKGFGMIIIGVILWPNVFKFQSMSILATSFEFAATGNSFST